MAPLSILPSRMSVFGALPFRAAAVLPKPLPPEVANRKIFLPEKSLLSRNVLMIVGATYYQMGNARKMVS